LKVLPVVINDVLPTVRVFMVRPEGRFHLSSPTQLSADVPADRLDRRRSLLRQFDNSRRALDAAVPSASFDRYQQMAFSLLTTGRMRQALDVGREPASVRESYGMTLFGQGCLTARRLIEAGCPVGGTSLECRDAMPTESLDALVPSMIINSSPCTLQKEDTQ
jgi:hypothetical protein